LRLERGRDQLERAARLPSRRHAPGPIGAESTGRGWYDRRRRAARLGLQAGALYRHFPSKRALLDAVVEQLVAEAVSRPAPRADWADQLRHVAFGLRRTILARRDGARLLGVPSAVRRAKA